MVCSNCGMNNQSGFKFCVKCGSSLEAPKEPDYEQVDMGNYHSEEEFSDDNMGFTMDTGTFVIKDTAPQSTDNSLFSSDELNETQEEFDFSMYDEPSMSSLEPPAPVQSPPPQYSQQPQQTAQTAYVQQNANPYMQQQSVMYGQPQIVGYDPNGMPIYGQSQGMMYGQPQIIGYDLNGMPIYSPPQPMPYGQPQGMMYGQPQIMGYDPSGMPIYAQPGGMMNQPVMPNGANIPPYTPQYGSPRTMQTAEPVQSVREEAPEKSEKSEDSDFWSFFNGGSDVPRAETNDLDFFGKTASEPQIRSDDPFADIDERRKKRLRAQQEANGIMGDTPTVNASDLQPNESADMSRFFMRHTGDSRSADLTVGTGAHKTGSMEATMQVDADKLSKHLDVRSRVSMQNAGEADPSTLEKYVPEHKEALMAQADHAVEAMPKKINPYESELDKIELPEYMKAKKTVREEKLEIPGLPDLPDY